MWRHQLTLQVRLMSGYDDGVRANYIIDATIAELWQDCTFPLGENK